MISVIIPKLTIRGLTMLNRKLLPRMITPNESTIAFSVLHIAQHHSYFFHFIRVPADLGKSPEQSNGTDSQMTQIGSTCLVRS